MQVHERIQTNFRVHTPTRRPFFLHLYVCNIHDIQQTTFHIRSFKTHFTRKGLSLLRTCALIGTTLLLTCCEGQVLQTDNSEEGAAFQIADSTKTRLKSEFIAMYKTCTDSFNQEEAEKMAESFLQDFIEKKSSTAILCLTSVISMWALVIFFQIHLQKGSLLNNNRPIHDLNFNRADLIRRLICKDILFSTLVDSFQEFLLVGI